MKVKTTTHCFFRHSGEGRSLEQLVSHWIPACAGMTVRCTLWGIKALPAISVVFKVFLPIRFIGVGVGIDDLRPLNTDVLLVRDELEQ